MNNVSRETWIDLQPLKAKCIAILPTVFSDEMSYYEVLCKLQCIMNGTISNLGILKDEMDSFMEEVNQTLQDLQSGEFLMNNLQFLDQLLQQYVVQAVTFGLTQSGYFVATYPESWEEIEFGTTGYDIETDLQPQFGHLTLSY